MGLRESKGQGVTALRGRGGVAHQRGPCAERGWECPPLGASPGRSREAPGAQAIPSLLVPIAGLGDKQPRAAPGAETRAGRRVLPRPAGAMLVTLPISPRRDLSPGR